MADKNTSYTSRLVVKLIGEGLTGGWAVRDETCGHSVWWPDEDAHDEIADSDDPGLVAVRICCTAPERGEWHS